MSVMLPDRPLPAPIALISPLNLEAKVIPCGPLVLVVVLRLADVVLSIELEAEPPYKLKLGFEEIDVILLVLHERFEQVAADVILNGMAVGRGLLVQSAGAHLCGEVAVKHLLDGLTDVQRVENLHIGEA